jgi:phospholipase/carboxylesterase
VGSTSEPPAIWRRPPRNGPTTPLVVLLHGLGADEHDLFPLAERFPPAFAVVSVRGPVAAEGGYTWFESRGPGRPIAKSLRAAVAGLRAWLDDPATVGPQTRIFLLGFSAGMMMAGALVLDDPARFAGAILLSGVLPLDSGFPVATGRLQSLPLLYANGSLDTVIPPPLVAQTQTFLELRSGADLTVRTYRHGHAISPREIDDIGAWLSEHA